MTNQPDDLVEELLALYQNMQFGHIPAFKIMESVARAAATIKELKAEVERITDERDEALCGPWPEWAEKIHKQLASYGYEPEDGMVDLPSDLACWLENFDPADQARAAKAEEALRVIATNKTKLGITWAQEYAREALGEEKA